MERDPRIERRWLVHGVSLDIIPAGPRLRAQGFVRWGDHTMSFAGLHLAFEHAVAGSLCASLVFRVAPPAVVVILKMISYCERPGERDRDLGDFVHLLDEYVGADDDRRFEDHVVAANLGWDDVSAHELGVDLQLLA